MAKVKIEVVNAIIDGHTHGQQLEVGEKDAEKLEGIGYAKRVAVVPKATEAPKSKAKGKK